MRRYLSHLYHWISAAALVFAVVFLSSWGISYYYRQNVKAEPALTSECNAMWLGHSWIEDEHTEDEIRDLAMRLRDHNIACVYLHTTPLLPDGTFDTSRAQYLEFFLKTFRHTFPDSTIYAWMGILTEDYEGTTIGTKINLRDYPLLQTIEQTAFDLVDNRGFDGIHLDMEPVENESTEFLIALSGLHEGLKARGKLLSTAVIFLATPDRQVEWLAQGKPFFWSWLPDYYETVSLYTDQLVLMSYNIGISDPLLYAERIAWHMQQVQPARTRGTSVLIGLPTYGGKYAGGENLAAGLEGYKQGLLAGNQVEGFAVYSEWTTDLAEWDLLQN